MAENYKDTLKLPKTAFPMRANLGKREPARVEHWGKIDLYGKIQSKNANGPTFVLHDGPPFTNGDLHLGHALNKTLKEIVNIWNFGPEPGEGAQQEEVQAFTRKKQVAIWCWTKCLPAASGKGGCSVERIIPLLLLACPQDEGGAADRVSCHIIR